MEKNYDTSELQKKAQERTVRTQNIEYDLETLVKKISRNEIKLDPDYQRKHRWDPKTSSRLIESLILNIPIPVIYLSYDYDVDIETPESRYSVIDGQQRLTAIYDFFKEKYFLTELHTLSELEGHYYKDLPPFLIRRLEDRTIKCLRIDSTIDSQVKYDIFERLNSGSVELTPQELRNSVYRGCFNDTCKKLAKYKNFRKLLQISIEKPEENKKVKKMEDVELVIRFFSLIDNNYKRYKKSKNYNFVNFLSDNLEIFNKLSIEEIELKEKLFKNTIDKSIEIFGELAFSKYKFVNNKKAYQSRFNNSVYDAVSVAVYEEVIKSGKKYNKNTAKKLEKLFSDESFITSISGSTLDIARIVKRIDTVRELFK